VAATVLDLLIRFLICSITLVLLATTPLALAVERDDADDARTALTNLGFLSSPPAALKRKFPMCDAFLKVQWISKEKQIGYSEYETPLTGIHGRSAGRRKVSVLVVLREPFGPEVRYALRGFPVDKDSGVLDKLFEAVRHGKIEGHEADLWILAKRTEDSFFAEFAAVHLEDGYSYHFDAEFSDYRQTVCVVYPDGRRAWIVEGKRPEKMYDKAQLDALLGTLKDSGAGIDKGQLEKSWVLDMNGDGTPDYYSSRGLNSKYTYSVGRRYYSSRLVEGTGTPTHSLPTFSFPPWNGRCRVPTDWGGRIYLTTDGESYFINTQCNLTKLTTQPGEK